MKIPAQRLGDTESSRMRRSGRDRQPVDYNDKDDDDEEYISDNSEEEVSEDGLTDKDYDEDDLNVNLEPKSGGGPSKIAMTRRTKRNTEEENEERTSSNTLFEAAKRSGALEAVATDWMEDFRHNHEEALVEIINCVFLAAGGDPARTYETPCSPLDMTDGDWGDLLEGFVSDRSEAIMGDQGVEGEGPLMDMHLSCFGGTSHYSGVGRGSKKSKALKKIRAGYEELWQRLVQVTPDPDPQSNPGADQSDDGEDNPVGTVIGVLVVLSDARLASLRLAATVALQCLNLEMARKRAKTTEKLSEVTRGIQAKRGNPGGAPKTLILSERKLSLTEARLESLMEGVFEGCTNHRHLDVHAAVAAAAVEGLGRCIAAFPEKLATDGFVKYLGWSLRHCDSAVRLAGVSSLLPLCVNELSTSLRAFFQRFWPDVVLCCRDGSPRVVLQALKLMRKLLHVGHLVSDEDADELDEIHRIAFDRGLPIEARSESLLFCMDRLEAFDEEENAHLNGDDAATRKLASLARLAAWQGQEVAIQESVTASKVSSVGQAVDAFDHASVEEVVVSEAALAAGVDLVDALWPIPEGRSILQRWKAAFLLLFEDEVLNQEGLEALSGSEKVAVLAFIQRSAELFMEDVEGGRGITKANINSAVTALKKLSVQLLGRIPGLIASFSSDVTPLEIVVRLSKYIAKFPPPSLQHSSDEGSGSLLIELLQALHLTMVSSLSDSVSLGVAESLGSLANADHGNVAVVHAEVTSLLVELAEKASSGLNGTLLVVKGRRGPEFALAQALHHLKHMVQCSNPWGCMDFSAVWTALIGTMKERASMLSNQQCLVVGEHTSARRLSSEGEALRQSGEVIVEAGGVLIAAFLWKFRSLMLELRICGKESKNKNKDQAHDAVDEVKGDNLTNETQDIVRLRDDLVDMMKIVLDISREVSLPTIGDIHGDEEESTPLSVLPVSQAAAIRAAQAWAYTSAAQLRAPLKVLWKTRGVCQLQDIAWVASPDFVSALQNYFLDTEDRLSLEAAAEQDGKLESASSHRGNKRKRPNDKSKRPKRGNAGEALGAVEDEILPLLMSITMPAWYDVEHMRLKQVAAAVRHVIEHPPGGRVSEHLKSFLHALKQQNPNKLLEVHMATLRVFFEDWTTPNEDEVNSDDDETVVGVVGEGMIHWLRLASRLSMSIGVGSANVMGDVKNALDLFMKEGIRYSLQGSLQRLPFLEGLGCYVRFLPQKLRQELLHVLEEKRGEISWEARRDMVRSLKAFDQAANAGDERAARSVPRGWRAYLIFRQQLTGAKGGPNAFYDLIKSPRGKKFAAALSKAALSGLSRPGTYSEAASDDYISASPEKKNGVAADDEFLSNKEVTMMPERQRLSHGSKGHRVSYLSSMSELLDSITEEQHTPGSTPKRPKTPKSSKQSRMTKEHRFSTVEYDSDMGSAMEEQERIGTTNVAAATPSGDTESMGGDSMYNAFSWRRSSTIGFR